ncbi:hypothetical protein SAMN05444280_10230 [Tangfeifania diversioriginum]|uniref:Thiamine pyrophosphate enzyme, N-terminal TPP binding domain n=1 Tax=Tangfeifania diversioriginum TaxID=1168035 RepID=A0A1M6AZI3_9BACT|nr:hypothetical protein [Tangfeifania diversioriginum]SHI41633.1 hypothetical protein SAMN05444280_10230 [Tangfeifania diversioriginum]
MPTVANKFARTLKAIGVRYVFGVPSGNMTDYTYPDKTEQEKFRFKLRNRPARGIISI